MTTTLVWGLAVAGEAVARAAVARGERVVLADDRPDARGRRCADDLGVELHAAPRGDRLAEIVGSVDQVVPSPGVPEHHPLVASALAAGVPLRTELDLAYDWEQQRTGGPRPMVAITGTDGKTTVTTLAREMVRASGRSAIDAGNTDTPLVSALDLDVEVFVVEATSFRLRWIETFRPEVGTWLNLAADHLDWHPSVEAYAAAKARIWEHQRATDVAVAALDDPVVMAHAAHARARLVTVGAFDGDYCERDGTLTSPHGDLVAVEAMWRSLPHDRTNALAAAATVLEAGVATIDGVARALESFGGIPHRIALVADHAGVRWYDDSKATTPHAALAAIAGFDEVVLIAGGRNKALDLGELAAAADRVRAVVAIGEAAGEISRAFEGRCPVVTAQSMDDAVRAAGSAAAPGQVVLLSPACASWDWYDGYAARGDDFARAVRDLIGAGS